MSKKERKRAKKKEKMKEKKRKKQRQKRKKKRHRKKQYDSSSSDSDSSSSSESNSSESSSESESDSDSNSDTNSDSDSNSGAVINEKMRPQNKLDDDQKDSNQLDQVPNHQDDNAVDDGLQDIDLSVLNWKTVQLNGSKRSYRIRNLVHGWSYLVRIRGHNESGYGQYSIVKKVSTKTINLLWNQHKHGKGVTFISGNRCKFSSKQAKIVVDYKVKAKMHKVFCWEFKMDRISNYSWIGFVRGPIKKTISNWNQFLGSVPGEFSIGFGSGSKVLSIQQHGAHNHGQSMPLNKTIRTGDRFKFKANMKNRTCSVYHNGKSTGVVFQNIPSVIVPAASNNSSHMDITVKFASR